MSRAWLESGARAIERLARQAVPAAADFCLVHFASGRTVRCVAAVHSTRTGTRDVRALMATHRIRPDDRDSTVAHVMRTGRTTVRTAIRPEDDSSRRSGRVADLHRRLAPTSALVVPIRLAGAVVGALSLCYSHSGRAYTSRHVAAAERLATAIAAALAPSLVPDASGLHAAARHPRQGAAIRRRLAARD